MTNLSTCCRGIENCPWIKQSCQGKFRNEKVRTWPFVNDGTLEMGTPLRIDVDSTSIISIIDIIDSSNSKSDEFPRHFHVLFRYNFTHQKIDVVSTYILRRNFTGQKMHVISTYFFRRNFADRKIFVVSTYFFRYNFYGRKIRIVST